MTHTRGIVQQLREFETDESLPDEMRRRARQRRKTLESRHRDYETTIEYCEGCESVVEHEIWQSEIACRTCVVERVHDIQDEGFRAVRRQRGGA